jgi:hypothetical protein
MEKENFREGTKEPELLWFYGISAKRYVLYNLEDRKPIIRKYSLHRLAHITNPFDNDTSDDWQKQIWEDILGLNYDLVKFQPLFEKYSGCYAVSKISIRSPEIMKRFKVING